MPKPWALIAGGGTAGHTLPGIAIARALVARGHRADTIRFVGSRRGTEARLVPEAGFEITLLPGRGIQRRLTLANIGAILGLVGAGFRALGLVLRRRPSVLVAVGGYASVACTVAAFVARVPIVVAEQNAVPGAANRLAARLARAAAVAFDGTPLPRAVTTGNPVRAEILAVAGPTARAAARDRLDLDPSRTVILAFGGSLGATRLNEAVIDAVRTWSGRADLAVRHVVGDRDWPQFADRVRALSEATLQYQPVRYDDDMPTAYAAADLLVCRAGATTVAELTVVGLPAVLVPFPAATADHQTANARALVEAGAATLVADGDFTGPRLVAEVETLLSDRDRLTNMAAAAASMARPDAADRVVDLVEEHARGA